MRRIIAKWIRTWCKTEDQLLVRLLSVSMGDEGDGVSLLKGSETCSCHLPCRSGGHLMPFVEGGNQRKKSIAAILLQ